MTNMNKGTAIVGFLLAFLAGAGLMWGMARNGDVQLAHESRASSSGRGHASSPIPITLEDPSWGSADAPVTIIELSDFECPFCARVLPTVQRVEKEYGPDRVRVVWKHDPLGSHPNARPTAEAAAAVQKLGGDFWKFHDLAFENQKELSADNRLRWAQAAGVDGAKFRAELESGRAAAKVDRDIALARQIGSRGTPHFRINGKAISGAQPYETFKQLIDEQLAAADVLEKSGVARGQLSLELTRKNFAPGRVEVPQQKAAPAEDTSNWRVPVSDADPSKGPSDALVTIIELSDFECPFCSRVLPTLKRLDAEYPGDLRWVWKDNPMAAHRRARPAAYLARHARAKLDDPGFWAAHDALFASQKTLDDAGLQALAGTLGLDWLQAERAITSGRYAADVDAGIALARSLSAAGTPYFFINGRRLVGAQPYERFKALVDTQLGIARGLVQQGVRRDRVYAELMKSAKTPAEPEKKAVPAPTVH
jgi:protein-disulfide isomerase